MKTIFALLMLFGANAHADIITLKDGTRLEGAIEGEMDGVAMVKTRYGILNIKKDEIISMTKEEARDPLATPAPVISVSSAPAELPAEPAPAPIYTFKTVVIDTSTFEKVYFESGVVIATETFDSKGVLLRLEGPIKDGSYTEYYDNGNIKTEKTLVNAKTSGTLKAYYPNGILQSEAYYLAGSLNGAVRIYNETSKLLFEQNFKDGIPNGYFREFDESAGLKSELFYVDGRPAEKPTPPEIKKIEAVVTPESMLTTKTQKLARGERFSFYLNNKYVAKVHLDKEFNIISKDGKVPNGAVKIYSKDGKLEKEFVFLGNEISLFKVFDESGTLSAEYTYQEEKAVKK